MVVKVQYSFCEINSCLADTVFGLIISVIYVNVGGDANTSANPANRYPAENTAQSLACSR
jgi:hypothetical protein